MIINDQIHPVQMQITNYELYEEIKKYELFFNDELLEIVEIADVTFINEIDDYFLSKSFKNELTYHTLASRCTALGRYLESIYFCKKVKEMYINDENYKRIYYINLILIADYNYLLKFENSNLLAEKQLRNLSAIKNNDLEYQLTKSIYVMTFLGLKDYKKVISLLENKQNYKLTEMVCLLISYYAINKSEYNKIYNELITKIRNENNKNCLILLHEVLNDKSKKRVIDLDKYNINKCIIEILKKCF